MKIAYHRVIITPEEPSYLCGHAMRVHKHEGVLDDIYITLMRLSSNGEEYVFGSVDLVGLDQELLYQMKEKIISNGIKEKHIILSVIHTHSAVEYMDINTFSNDPTTGARPGYRDFLVDRMQEAFNCCTDWKEVTCSYAHTQIDGFYGNRNNIEFPCDKNAYLLRFEEGDEPIFMIANISCHPTVLGPQNLKISADLFGAIRDDLKDFYGTEMFMMNGAQGDVSNRQYRQGNDKVELIRMKRGICAQLHNLKFEKINIEPISLKDITYVIDYMSHPEDIDHEIERARHILETATDPDIIKVTKSGIAFMELNKRQDPHVHEEIKTRIINMGNLYIISVGAELFTKFSLQIKGAFPNKEVIIWGICDASTGYLVEQEEYGKNYESMTTRIPRGEVERYVDHIIHELEILIKE